MVMKTKDNRNNLHHSEHLSIWFSQSVQHRTKCMMNTEIRHLHLQRYNPAVLTNTAINLNPQAPKRRMRHHHKVHTVKCIIINQTQA